MSEVIRKQLNASTDELIERFVPYNKEEVHRFRSGLRALHHIEKNKEAQDKTNLYAVESTEVLKSLLAQHHVSEDFYHKLPAFLSTEGDKPAVHEWDALPENFQYMVEEITNAHIPAYEVPAPGMVAIMLNLVNDPIKYALTASRAVDQVIHAIERIESLKVSSAPVQKSQLFQDTLYDYGDTTRLARPYIAGFGLTPSYVSAAKALQHLAELCEVAVKLLPKIVEEEEIREALTAFTQLTVYILTRARDALHHEKANDAAEKIGELAVYFQQKHPSSAMSIPDAVQAIEAGMKCLDMSLQVAGILTTKEAKDFSILLEERVALVGGIY